MSGSSAIRIRNALHARALALWPQDTQPVRVSYGHPGVNLPDQLVMVGNPTSDQGYGPMGTARNRDETVSVPVTFSVWVGGGAEAQRLATDAANALLVAFEADLQTDPRLGLTHDQCRGAAVVGIEVAETDETWTDVDGTPFLTIGRGCDIATVIQAKARI